MKAIQRRPRSLPGISGIPLQRCRTPAGGSRASIPVSPTRTILLRIIRPSGNDWMNLRSYAAREKQQRRRPAHCWSRPFSLPGLPAIEGYLVEVGSHVSARLVEAVHLHVHNHRTLVPSQRFRRASCCAREGALCAIESPPVGRCIAGVIMMEAYLDVVPGVRGPGPGIALDIRCLPVRAAAAVVGPFPCT